jgi:transglutaminase-like putative cysteine protease
MSGLTQSLTRVAPRRTAQRVARRFSRPAEDSLAVRGATLLAVLVAVAAVGLQEEFKAQAALAAVAIVVAHGVSYLRRRSPNWWMKLAIVALIFGVARDFFVVLVANPYDPRIPLVRLFLWLQVLHSFDLPARKDLKYSLASAVVLMAVGAVYARETAFGLLLVPFTLAAGISLAAMQAEHGRPSWWALAGLGVRLSVAVLVCAALAFTLVPRGGGLRLRGMPVSARLLWVARLHTRIVNPAYPDEPGTDPEQAPPVFNPQGYVGFSTYVDLRLRGVLDDTLVLRVRATRPGYWRGLAFDTYTGRGWRMSDQSVEEFTSDQSRIVPRLGPDEPWPAGSEQSIQTFYVEAEQPNVIFAAYRPFEIFFPTGAIGVDRYAGMRSPLRLEQGMIYSVISRIPAPAEALLARGHGDVPAPIRARYLQLPAISPRVRRLASELTTGAKSPYQQAEAIRRYLRRGFRYTLQAPLLPDGADAVDEFLFVTRQGSCETFASTLAVLLRAAGIPARLVTGYTTGSYNVFTGYYEVRNSDAHAWVEMFQPGAGWIEMEATPGFVSTDETVRRPAGQWLAGDAASWMLGAIMRTVHGLSGIRGGQGSAAATLVVGATLLAGLLGAIHVRRRGRMLRGVVEVRYDAMLRVLARRGYIRRPAMTPSEFAASLPVPVRPAAGRMTRLFEACRYGQRPADPGIEAATQRALLELRDAARRAPTASTRSHRSPRASGFPV